MTFKYHIDKDNNYVVRDHRPSSEQPTMVIAYTHNLAMKQLDGGEWQQVTDEQKGWFRMFYLDKFKGDR